MDPSKKLLAALGFLYLVFVVYGSLVPLAYTPIPSDEAWERFKDIQYLNLGIASRADWVANILLFIPLAFLGLGTMWSRFNPALNLFNSVLVLVFSIGLCLVIEYTQLYFPPRTVSLNDILAETTGALIGVGLWWKYGEFFKNWLSRWRAQQSQNNRLKRVLHSYIAILFFYNVMPLDLTISPVELYHKWNEGRIMLIPFGFYFADPASLIYNLVTDMLIWVPVPIIHILSAPKRKLYAFNWTMLSAIGIEFAQLFVYSRVTDITDLITALIGAGVGVWLGDKIQRYIAGNDSNFQTNTVKHSYTLYAAIGFGFWSFVLPLVFWYPFQFRLERDFITDRFGHLLNVPFVSYYFGTEFRALTELLHKFVFFAPLGVALAIIVNNLKYQTLATSIKWTGWLWIALLATGIELGQLALPDKFPNNTDIILEVIGALIGYWVYQFVQKRVMIKNTSDDQTFTYQTQTRQASGFQSNFGNLEKPSQFQSQTQSSFKLIGLALWFAVTAVALFVLGKLPVIPYNVRELVSGHIPLLTSVGISIFLFCCFGLPVWFIDWLSSRPRANVLMLAGGIILHAFVTSILIRLAAPLESIHDVAGSPVLAFMPNELELLLRLMAFFGSLSLLLFGAVLTVFPGLKHGSNWLGFFAVGAVTTLLLSPVLYWAIIVEAATDNLIELLPNEGQSALILLLAAYLLLVFGIASHLSASLSQQLWRKLLWLIPVTVVSFPLGYWLIRSGTADFIMKYDKVFSALQFLLSANRDNYVDAEALALRFYVAHIAFIGLVAFIQFPFWRRVQTKQRA